MKCSDAKILLMDFLYKEISDENKKLLKEHLSTCAACGQEFQSLKDTSKILKKWETKPGVKTCGTVKYYSNK